ncbi:hypothetical protein PR003_g22632 [Phytophthora rubi]|uniref:Uncharacterized protein n=1 Tax=Phytophthora rubi TaxID=129364 RepID=A0A6A3J2V0_9STRA|nr:hypothetical protein PR002_g22277 [Phytophthora rubi]KAE8988840.1 hypothetical protein PR001_g21929 [Phytophthora rubi]KAE9300999.1 hypothetical protein PR003_g22632 [Phytophthora rubi]
MIPYLPPSTRALSVCVCVCQSRASHGYSGHGYTGLAERSDGGTRLANKLPSAAKAAPAAEGGPTGGYCGTEGPALHQIH